jgi:hypothetical protein
MADEKPLDQEITEGTEQVVETADESGANRQSAPSGSTAFDKPLDKYTVKELKEMALALGTIQGVSAMKKQELIDALKIAYDIPLKKERSSEVVSILDIKKQIRSLKKELASLHEGGDRNPAVRLRKKISRLKKKTRQMARQLG